MKAWELLSDKSKWTTNTRARDGDGNEVRPKSKRAVCWCAVGAIEKCYPVPSSRAAKDLAFEAAFRRYCCGVISVNDDLGYDAVLAVLKEADV